MLADEFVTDATTGAPEYRDTNFHLAAEEYEKSALAYETEGDDIGEALAWMRSGISWLAINDLEKNDLKRPIRALEKAKTLLLKQGQLRKASIASFYQGRAQIWQGGVRSMRAATLNYLLAVAEALEYLDKVRSGEIEEGQEIEAINVIRGVMDSGIPDILTSPSFVRIATLNTSILTLKKILWGMDNQGDNYVENETVGTFYSREDLEFMLVRDMTTVAEVMISDRVIEHGIIRRMYIDPAINMLHVLVKKPEVKSDANKKRAVESYLTALHRIQVQQ